MKPLGSASSWLFGIAISAVALPYPHAVLASSALQGSTSALPDITHLRTRGRSRIELVRNSGAVEIFLFAADERIEVQGTPYCGANQGQKSYFGSYRLVSTSGDRVNSALDLGPDYYFVPALPHGGLHKEYDRNTGEQLVALYQYHGCNYHSAEFFRVGGEGVLHRVPFFQKDGTQPVAVSDSKDSAMFSQEGEWVFCWYNNFYGTAFCDSYRYENRSFVQSLSWMGACERQSPSVGFCAARGESTLTIAGEARRALHEFLFALERRNYKAASYYYTSSNESLRELDRELDPAIELLEQHCKRDGGACLMPWGIEEHDVANSPLVFAVSFRTPDHEEYQVGAQTSFEFRVAQVGNGYKVLDLPPTGPPPPL